MVRIYNDWRDVPDDSALTVTVLDKNRYRPGKEDSASITLEDDDFASILVLTTSHAEITEGEDLTCSVIRFGGVTDYGEQFGLVVSGTGRGRNVNLGGLIKLDAGDHRHDVTIELPDDGRADGNWSYTCWIDWVDPYVPLEQESQYFTVVGPRSITVPVWDAGGSRVTIEAVQSSITEGETATFTLTRAADTSENLSVNISVEDPGHFMRGNHTWEEPQPASTVDFEAGSATATLTLSTRDDWRDIPGGKLTVAIEPGDNDVYRPGDTSSAAVTVKDNDTKPVFVLSVSSSTLTEGDSVVFELTRTVDFTHPQTVQLLIGRQGQQKSMTYDFRGDTATKQTIIPTQNDDLDQAHAVFVAEFDGSENEYYAVSEPYSVTATVADDDLPRVSVEALADSYREGERASFRLTREGQTDSTLPVKVKLTERGQKTVHNVEPQLGDRTPVMGESSATYDLHLFLDEGDGDEYDGAVDVELVASDDYVIDPEKSIASFTVLDTDPEPTLRLSSTNDTRRVSEGGEAIEFRVSYDSPPSQKGVTVDYSTLSRTAAAGVDYTATIGTLTIPDGETEAVISVPVTQDSRPEHDETFLLILSNPRNAHLEDGAQSLAALATIEDDESRVSIGAAAEEVTEGEPAIFTSPAQATSPMSSWFRCWLWRSEPGPKAPGSSLSHRPSQLVRPPSKLATRPRTTKWTRRRSWL